MRLSAQPFARSEGQPSVSLLLALQTIDEEFDLDFQLEPSHAPTLLAPLSTGSLTQRLATLVAELAAGVKVGAVVQPALPTVAAQLV